MNNFKDIILNTIPNADYSDTPPSLNTIEDAQEVLGCQFGPLLKSYLSECGYIGFSFVELYGMTERQGMNSDMISKTKLLHEVCPEVSSFIAVEDKGDCDYILCDSLDNIFEFMPSVHSKPVRMNLNLLDHIFARANAVS